MNYYLVHKIKICTWKFKNSLIKIITKSKRSVLYSKFDFVEQNQWMINKIFGNGMVSVFTKWSWFSDMKMIDISNHSEIYDILKQKVN